MLLHVPENKEKTTQEGQTFTVTRVAAVGNLTVSCFAAYSFEGLDANTGVTCVSVAKPYVAEADYPELARIWKNDSDAIFDTM